MLTTGPYEQGEVLFSRPAIDTALALQHFDVGNLLREDGLELVVKTLGEHFHKDADAEIFQKIETALYAESRKPRESVVRYLLRIQPAALLIVKPGTLDDLIRGYVLVQFDATGEGQLPFV